MEQQRNRENPKPRVDADGRSVARKPEDSGHLHLSKSAWVAAFNWQSTFAFVVRSFTH